MSVPESVKRYLLSYDVDYKVLPHPRTETLEDAARACNVPLQNVVRAVILKDDRDFLMAVLPASHMIDFAALHELVRRDLELAAPKAAAEIFDDCEPGSFPPLGLPYGIEAVVDTSVTDSNDLYFEPGNHVSLVRVSVEAFQQLQSGTRVGSFALPLSELKGPGPGAAAGNFSLQQTARRFAIQRRVEQIQELPAMPDMVSRLLQLRRNPDADAADLAKLIELDPSLAAQIVHYATSPFYGYRGQIESVRDAIARVLGFDVVMNIALGIAVGKSFQIPYSGPLGLRAFWRQAIYSAILSQCLAETLPAGSRPLPGMAYLSGLLHDFGHLLLGYMYPSEFFLLNRLIVANPDIPVTDLERHIIGVEHEQLGAWLMRSWTMPDELITTVRWHHRERYQGKHAVYSRLVMVAEHMLKRYGISDASSDRAPPAVLEALGIDEERAAAVATRIVEHGDALDSLARQLVA